MTPDTGALRARKVHPGYAGGSRFIIITPAERDALCDAADEVERLRGEAVLWESEFMRVGKERADALNDASALRTAHAALVADLRALCNGPDHLGLSPVALLTVQVERILDRHAPEEGR